MGAKKVKTLVVVLSWKEYGHGKFWTSYMFCETFWRQIISRVFIDFGTLLGCSFSCIRIVSGLSESIIR